MSEFDKVLTEALRAEGIKIGTPVRKAILSALSERDEHADTCTDKNGAGRIPIPTCAIMSWCR